MGPPAFTSSHWALAAKCLPKNTVLSEVLEGVELKLQRVALSFYLHTAPEKPEIAPRPGLLKCYRAKYRKTYISFRVKDTHLASMSCVRAQSVVTFQLKISFKRTTKPLLIMTFLNAGIVLLSLWQDYKIT